VSREQEKRLRALIEQWGLLIVSSISIAIGWIVPESGWHYFFAVLAIIGLSFSYAAGSKAKMPKDNEKEEPHA
jgi:hypothetical protein